MRIRHYVSLLILGVICWVVFWPSSALAYNSCMDDHSLARGNGLKPSIAWNDQYLFTAIGFNPNQKEATWDCEHFLLMRTDRRTGQSCVLMEDYEGAGISWLIDDDGLYVLPCKADIKNIYEMPKDAWGLTTYCTNLVLKKLNSSGSLLETIQTNVVELSDFSIFINDQLMADGIIYLAAESGIYSLDLQTGEIDLIYQAEETIQNDIYENHMVLEDDTLYVHDGNYLIALDLTNNSPRTVCYFESSHLTWDVFPSCTYKYIVLGDHIYFWDDYLRATVDYDLATGVKRQLSKDRYWFAQITSDGIFAVRIGEKALNEIYASLSYTCYHPEVERDQWNQYDQYLFFEFSNDGDLRFDPGSDRVIYLGDEDKSWLFLGKMQYVYYDFIYGDEVKINNLQR